MYTIIAAEEHIVFWSEPASLYIRHVTPDSGSSADIICRIIKFITRKNTTHSALVAFGCDGRNVIARKNGADRRLEIFVGRKLHKFVCVSSRLTKRHLGHTSSPEY